MPELSAAARGAPHGELPRARPGWWACWICHQPARRKPSLDPAREWSYHYLRYHLRRAA